MVCVAILRLEKYSYRPAPCLGSNCSSLQCDGTRVVCVAFLMVSHGNLDRIAPRPSLALCRVQAPHSGGMRSLSKTCKV